MCLRDRRQYFLILLLVLLTSLDTHRLSVTAVSAGSVGAGSGVSVGGLRGWWTRQSKALFDKFTRSGRTMKKTTSKGSFTDSEGSAVETETERKRERERETVLVSAFGFENQESREILFHLPNTTKDLSLKQF